MTTYYGHGHNFVLLKSHQDDLSRAAARRAIDGKICISQRKKGHKNYNCTGKNYVFHHGNIAYFSRRIGESQSYGNRTEDKTFDLLV